MKHFKKAIKNIDALQKKLLADLFEASPNLQSFTLDIGYYAGELNIKEINEVETECDYADCDGNYEQNQEVNDSMKAWLVETDISVEEVDNLREVVDSLRYCEWLRSPVNSNDEITHSREQYVKTKKRA